MKKALFIIAPINFRDEEFFEPKAILEKAEVEITCASLSTAIAKGKLGALVKPDIALKDVCVSDYDAFVFIGGSGASVYFADSLAHRIAQEAVKRQKLLAAICASVVILARAGVLKGIKATVFPTDKAELIDNGAKYSAKPVEMDGNIITGNGPQAARQFGQTIAQLLTKKS